ncbi:MAG: tetratricopeptide repeat protein [Thiohalocapsa sp.]
MDTTNRDEANLIDGQPEWWRENLFALLGGLLIIALLGAGLVLWQSRIQLHQTEAVVAVRQAPTTETKLKAAEQFLDVEAIAGDLLLIAADQYRQGEYAAALKTYQMFLANYSDHALNNAARLGQASAQEASGEIDAALKGFLSVSSVRPKNTYNPIGLLNAARIYQQQGDETKRKEILTQLANDYSDSSYGREAETILTAIQKTAPDTTNSDLKSTKSIAWDPSVESALNGVVFRIERKTTYEEDKTKCRANHPHPS